MVRTSLPPEFIEKVKFANNIVAVASRYLPVRAKGRTHWANCPFHHEKTPSFAINENDQYFKCFGCGVSGNVITLIKQVESTDFLGAVEILAKFANIEIPATGVDPGYAERKRKKEKLLEIIDHTKNFYASELYKPHGAEALKYLHKRGISDELIKKFNIGLSPNWDGLITYLRGKKFTEDEMIKSGAVQRGERGNLYDAMGNRITFSIFDIYNSCIGFTGRTLSDRDDIAKYKNTSQTMIFDKSSIVYGTDVLKKSKLSSAVEYLIVVEGNVDVITLVGNGYNTLASMGTAMTSFHSKIFKRFSNNIYLCFDGDKAGQKAALKNIDILANEGLSVRVIEMPQDIDPDTFITKNGKGEFAKLIDNAKPHIDYKLDELAKASNLNDSIGKSQYLSNALQILLPVANAPELELYLPKVIKNSGISGAAITKQLQNNARKQYSKATPDGQSPTKAVTGKEIPNSAPSNAYTKSVEFLLNALIHKRGVDPIRLLNANIKNETHVKIINEYIRATENGKDFILGYVRDNFDEEQQRVLDSIYNNPIHSDNYKMHIESCFAAIESISEKNQAEEFLREYKNTGDINFLKKYQEATKKGKP